MTLHAGGRPWFDLDARDLRFLEVHQTRAVAIPGRGWRDLGDAVMLFSAADREPFFNRLSAIRWPSGERAFEARLKETSELFEALDRRPYLWTIPDVSTPPDIVERLEARGFTDLGGGYDMLLVRDPFAAPDLTLPSGAMLERWNASPESELLARAGPLATVIEESFAMAPERHDNLVREIAVTLSVPFFHAYLVTLDGEPIATGQRYTFDGASYLSSIGTRPGWRGHGLGAAVTQALARDSVAEGARFVYLGVHTGNDTAIRVYERCGFEILGGRSADLLLE